MEWFRFILSVQFLICKRVDWMTKRHALSALTAKNLEAGKHADGEGLWLFKYDKSAGK